MSASLARSLGLRATRSTLSPASRRFPAAWSQRHNSTLPAGSQKDPAHPHLYYHLSPSAATPERVLVTYLPTRPNPDSATYIGSLPAMAGAGLASFVENPKFRPLLHGAIREAIAAGKADTVEYEAKTRPGDGYLNIADERNVPVAGRVGDPEDLIASVFVQDGRVVTSTYEPLPTYRLVTGNGVLTLPQGLDEAVVEALAKVDREEKGE